MGLRAFAAQEGVPCCDIADGHRTTWKGDEAGRYWVPINRWKWVEVPEEAVVYNTGNPFGEAVVWYTGYPNDENYLKGIFIRCFVPGNGV